MPRKKTMTATLILRLPPELLAQFNLALAQNAQTASLVLRAAIRDYVITAARGAK